MAVQNITPTRLIAKLSISFFVLIAAIAGLIAMQADALQFLPLGGTDALGSSELEITQSRLEFAENRRGPEAAVVTPADIRFAVIFLAANLTGTILIMLPIAWTYSATKFSSGPTSTNPSAAP